MRKAEPEPRNYSGSGTSSNPHPNLVLLEELLDDLHTYLARVGAPKSMLTRVNDMRQPIKYVRDTKK